MIRIVRGHPANPHALRRLFGRVLVLAAIVGVTMLGNLRLQASASEVASVERRPAIPRLSVSWMDPAEYGRSAIAERQSGDPQMAAVIDRDGVAEEGGDIQLVPAIYAWNPDVRFVYYRHVSKWM